MSFQPGVPLPMTRPLYATTTVPSGTMMVQMAPVRPVTMVPVSQVMVRPVMRPVISQSQAFVQTIQAQPMPQMMTNPVVQSSNQQKNTTSGATTEEAKKENDGAPHQNNSDSSNDPAITVFVGNITDRASDTLVRQMLMKCGSVYTWKRVQGPSGKLQAFGFCEYKDPESALRAIYVLRDYMLGDKKLLVKVDSKTQDLIDEWKKQKGILDDKESPSKPPGVDEVRAGLNGLIQEYASELNAPKPANTDKEEVMQILKPDPTVRESQNVEENLQELELEEDQKTFISKEIRSFRETQKLHEEKLKTQKEKSSRSRDDKDHSSKDKPSSSRSSRSEREDRDRRTRSPRSSIRRSRSASPPPRRTDSRRSPLIRRKRSRSPVSRVPIRRSPPRRRTRSPPPRRKTRSPPPRRKRSSSRSPMPWRRGEDDEDFEVHERRKLERKIKEKEAAYQERLRLYEARERRQKRLLEKRDERQETERKEMIREAKRLREFLADYEDDRSDAKYYVGNSLSKRLREREREIEADERDRKKEKEEIEILRKRLVEENHTDPDSAIAKVIAESDNIWKPLIEPDTPPRKSTPPPATSSSSSDDDDDSGSDEDSDAEKSDSDSSDSNYKDSPKKPEVKKEQMVATLQPVKEVPVEVAPVTNHLNKPIAEVKSEPVVKIEFGSRSSPAPAQMPSQTAASLSPQVSVKTEIKVKKESTPELTTNMLNSKRRKLTVSDVFNQDEEEDELPKRRKLVPLAYTDEERKALNPAKAAEDERKLAEEKRKMVRALIERIPTQKDDLFDYSLDWSMVDNSLMEKRIRPWITKKIIEYIGEEEPTLVEFICSKIMTKSSPEKILEDISMVLDEEADVFVVKMWRLLIYETEAKKEGLTK